MDLSSPPSHALASHSAKSGVITMLSQGFRTVMQFVTTAILARLLVPDDFGVVQVVMSFAFVITAVRGFGIGTAIIQRPILEPIQVHSLFLWSVALAATSAAAFALLGPLLAWFYDDDRHADLCVWFGISSGIASLGTVPRALIVRQMRFRWIGIQTVAGAVIGSLAAVVAAWHGAGYWALVVLPVVTQAVEAATVFLGARYLPMNDPGFTVGYSMMGFGTRQTISELLSNSVRNVDNIIIGRVGGTEVLGQYGNAYRLLLLPMRQINAPMTQVALPTLSRLQDQPERYRRFYSHALMLATSLGMPLVTCLALTADLVVPLFLGPGWDEAVLFFRILALPAFIDTFNFAQSWAFLSCGRPGRMLQWSAISTPFMLGAFLIGAIWGAYGVAIAFAATSFSMRWFALYHCFSFTIPTYGDFFRGVWRPAAASILGTGAVGLIRSFLGEPTGTMFIDAAIWVAAVGVAYAATWVLLPGGFKAFTSVLDTVKLLKPKAPPTAPPPSSLPASPDNTRPNTPD